jgi:HlyD family secretion protein
MIMDVQKPPDEIVRRRRRRIATVSGSIVAVCGAAYLVARTGGAVSAVDRAGLWIDTVKLGDLPRELRGVGELAPQDNASRWVSAELDGRVDRKLLERGASVEPNTIILQLSNRDVEQAAAEAQLELQGAEAAYASLDAALGIDLLALRSQLAAIDAEQTQAALQAEVDSTLARDGLLAELTSRQSEVRRASLTSRTKLERDRVRNTEGSVGTRLATQRAEVERRRALAQLKRRDLESMTVRAGMSGVLQEVVVEVGQRVSRNTNLARVVDATRLKAVLRIPEAQMHDLHLDMPAAIDTHSGIIHGRVARIAPSAQNGTVTIDVELKSELPPGARPDMTVDGSIELDRLRDARHIGRPSSGQADGNATLFKLSPDGREAKRISVTLGRASANEVRIVTGDLQPGDRVVLSDTSAWSGDKVRLR